MEIREFQLFGHICWVWLFALWPEKRQQSPWRNQLRPKPEGKIWDLMILLKAQRQAHYGEFMHLTHLWNGEEDLEKYLGLFSLNVAQKHNV